MIFILQLKIYMKVINLTPLIEHKRYAEDTQASLPQTRPQLSVDRDLVSEYLRHEASKLSKL